METRSAVTLRMPRIGRELVEFARRRSSGRPSSRRARRVEQSNAAHGIDPWSAAAIEQNRQWLMAYMLSLAGDPAVSDDLVQEVFTIAFQKRESFAPGTNFGGWLRGIARNVALRHCEARGRQPLVARQEVVERLDQAAAEGESRNMDPGWIETRKRFLRECVAKLTERVRRMLDLRYTRGCSATEVADALSQTVPSVNVALFRARQSLAVCVQRKEAFHG